MGYFPSRTAQKEVAAASSPFVPCRSFRQKIAKTSKDLIMKKTFSNRFRISVMTGAALSLGLAGAAAIAQPGSGSGERGMRADTNKDGVLTLDEVRAHARERFNKMDANNDGKIDSADREIRKAERFARIDTNNDGELSQAELAAARESRKAGRADRSAERFAAMDTDNSGGLSQAELDAAREGRKGRKHAGKGRMHGGMAMLKMADTNNDNAIDWPEFEAAALKRFAKMDTNSDGQVTAAEREAARAAMKERRKEWREKRGAGKEE